MDLTTKLTLAINAEATKTIGGTSTGKDPFVGNFADTMADGLGADKADKSWHDRRELDPSTTVDGKSIDNIYLYGVLEDAFGDIVNFTRIKCLMISLLGKAETGYEMYVGGHTTRAWETYRSSTGTGTRRDQILGGGMMFRWQPGAGAFGVNYLADDVLRIENVGTNNFAYDIVVLGQNSEDAPIA